MKNTEIKSVALISSILMNIILLFFINHLADKCQSTSKKAEKSAENIIDKTKSAKNKTEDNQAKTVLDIKNKSKNKNKIIDKNLKVSSIVINHSLYRSLSKAIDSDVATRLAAIIQRIIIWKFIPHKDLRNGDTLNVIYKESIESNSEEIIEALKLYSNKFKKSIKAYRYKSKNNNFHSYYDESGRDIALKLENAPIKNYEQITSLLGDGRGHEGMDFKTPVGTSIYMPWDAVVDRVNWNFKYNGNCIKVRFPQKNLVALFLHMNPLDTKKLKPGITIKKGSAFAETGNSGRSTAPHLHYQLESPAGKIKNPLKIHKTYNLQLSAKEVDQLKLYIEKMDNLMKNDV